MSVDVMGNVLTTLTNAQRVGKKRVALPYSGHKKDFLEFLQRQEVVGSVRVQESPKAKLVVTLAYDEAGQPKITGAKRLSAPGRRWYAKHTEIPFTYEGYGFIVVSTSDGLMVDQVARKRGVGGELVCAIW